MMSLLTLREKDKLKELKEYAVRADALRRQIEEILKTLKELYGGDINLKFLVERLVEKYSPPGVEGEEVKLAAGSLKEYTEVLEKNLKELTGKVKLLENITLNLKSLERNVEELKKWRALLKDISEFKYVEASRALEKYERLVRSSPTLSLEELTSDIAILNDEFRYQIRTCKNIFFKKLKKVRDELESTVKLLSKAIHLALMEEKSRVDSISEKLKKIDKILEYALKNAPNCHINLNELYKEIVEYGEELKKISSKSLGGEELEVLKQFHKLASAYGSKTVQFYNVVEYISRRTGYPIEDVQKILYKLNKRNVINLSVKLA